MWRGEVRKGLVGWDEAEKEHLGEELSDVLLYLVQLSDMCGVDLGDAAVRKIAKNAVKYPAPPPSKKEEEEGA
jgi:dCTP diphosphatase